MVITNSGKRDNSQPSDTAVKSDVSVACLPTSVESYNNASVRRLQSGPQRHLTCFLRTKSDGAISSSSSRISSPFSSVVDATNKPLAITLQALSGYLPSPNGTRTGRVMCDIKLKKRTYQPPIPSNSTQWPRDAVIVRSECCESDDSVEFQQKVPKSCKNDDRNSPHKLPAASPVRVQSSGQSSYSFRPTSAIRWNERFAAMADASSANAQKMSTVGKPNMNTCDSTYCTAVPLSTSNIVNVSHPCPVAGQNSTNIRRRVILIRRR